ncbi:dihydroxyacetone kinase subunit DhaL [Rhizobium grahamii]|uniref:Dihydroxyacetone kinase, L subunit n=2 Tax=Rhizobium grahamii TaxID=1120045 RepID=S3H943_9HYPH|nr:dihydroxyacetone kinase subunit DhaL [Rhizobium grahamii]EPE95104.1 dihydroxyacetone kinase, L subunit [Rhizobium grahamii CCGE 502]RDJ07057.1 dihydroxyacetone kinase subunit L [Rhizobium grahamii]
MQIGVTQLQDMFGAIAEAMRREKERLCELDGVIGDADHGIAMEIGFSAAATTVAALDPAASDPTTVFNSAAKSFLSAVGASSGPLYATAFMRAGSSVKGKPILSDDDMVDAFEAMANGIKDRGKADPGDKTMIDAWVPATAAARSARLAGKPLGQCLSAALEAAVEGAEATKDMIAAKGRSSRLGERVIGHMDPGAASAVVLIEAILRTFDA